MNKRFILFFTSLLAFPFINSWSQTSENPRGSGWGIEVLAKGGKMIKHTQKFTGPISDFVYGTEINFIQKTYGKKEWQQITNYPTLGFSINYLNYNNRAVYGQVFGISPNITLPLWTTDKLEWTLRAGMGVGLVTKHYRRAPDNNVNVAIGGALNNVSPFAMDIRYKINHHWHVQAGLNFTHVSNATFQTPNLGINTWGAHIGARYFPVTDAPERIVRDPKPTFRNNFMGFIRGGIAFVEKGPADGPTYNTYIAQAGIAKRYASKNKVYAGMDIHYHSHVYHYEIYQGIPVQSKFNSAGQLALFAGHEYIFGKVGVVAQMGYYIVPYASQNTRLYQKLGGTYYFLRKEQGIIKEVYATALLKTHLTVAELFEMGFGISF